MTLPASGPISLNDLCTEYGLPSNSVFPGAFYGKPGIPASGPLGLADFYGKSNFAINSDKSVLNRNDSGSSSGSATAFFTATQNCTWSYSVISGAEPPVARRQFTATTATTANYVINNPALVVEYEYIWTIRVQGVTLVGGIIAIFDLPCTLRKTM
jgi:hypothetical protein